MQSRIRRALNTIIGRRAWSRCMATSSQNVTESLHTQQHEQQQEERYVTTFGGSRPVQIAFEYDYGEAIMRALKGMLIALGITPFAYYVYTNYYREEITAQRLKRKAQLHVPSTFSCRHHEVEMLEKLFANLPDRVCIVTGPTDAGKSAVLHRVLNGRSHTMYLSLREHSITSVSEFVRAFIDSMDLRYLQFRSQLIDSLPIAGGENFQMRDQLSHVEFQQSLDCLTKALEIVRRDDPQCIPVIVLDEFDVLMKLIQSSEGYALMQALLSWCIHITKERHLAHIVFGIADSAVMHHMRFFGTQAVSNRIRFVTIDDLNDEQIRSYCQRAIELNPNIHINSQDIERIVNKIGGRILDIDCVLHESTSHIPIETSINRIIHMHMRRMIGVLTLDKNQHETNNENVDEDEDDEDQADASDTELMVDTLNDDSDNNNDEEEESDEWKSLKVWNLMGALVESKNGSIPYARVCREYFNNNDAQLQSLIIGDIFGCRVDSTDNSFHITAEAPAAMHCYKILLRDPYVKQRMTMLQKKKDLIDEIKSIHNDLKEHRRQYRSSNKAKREMLKSIEILTRMRPYLSKDVYEKRIERLQDRDYRIAQRENTLTDLHINLLQRQEAVKLQLIQLEHQQHECTKIRD